VDVTHGEDSSQHVLTYTDRDRSGTLTCGDIIGTVS
jgi:hypothetical protein